MKYTFVGTVGIQVVLDAALRRYLLQAYPLAWACCQDLPTNLAKHPVCVFPSGAEIDFIASMDKFASVEAYIDAHEGWKELLTQLRKILLLSGLKETIKWNFPCYTAEGSNVVGMGAFKSYCGLWFFQGSLLPDPARVLVNAQKGKTRALRQWRFQQGDRLDEELLLQYVEEAIGNLSQGKQVQKRRSSRVVIPPELSGALEKEPELMAAFRALTKGRRREYAEYITEARRSDTKQRRLEKILPMILDGVGLSDKYRK